MFYAPNFPVTPMVIIRHYITNEDSNFERTKMNKEFPHDELNSSRILKSSTCKKATDSCSRPVPALFGQRGKLSPWLRRLFL